MDLWTGIGKAFVLSEKLRLLYSGLQQPQQFSS